MCPYSFSVENRRKLDVSSGDCDVIWEVWVGFHKSVFKMLPMQTCIHMALIVPSLPPLLLKKMLLAVFKKKAIFRYEMMS